MSVIDISGQRFGRLVVIERAPSDGGQARWWCDCDCGARSSARSQDLRSGHTKSCGCAVPRHGLGTPPELAVWKAMRRRCETSANADYAHYGARGIVVCERWKAFANFYADMGPRPTPKHQIERRDNDGGYCPENCVWATKVEQMSNTRRTRRFNIGGETITAAQYARREGMSYSGAYARLQRVAEANNA